MLIWIRRIRHGALERRENAMYGQNIYFGACKWLSDFQLLDFFFPYSPHTRDASF